MSFVGTTLVLPVETPRGENFRLYLTQQIGGYWVSTVLHMTKESVPKAEVNTGADMVEAWERALEWCQKNIDSNVKIPDPS